MNTEFNTTDIKKALAPLTEKQLKTLPKADLIELILGEQKIRDQLEDKLKQAEEYRISVEGKYIVIKKKLFSSGSERSSQLLDDKKLENGQLTDSQENNTKNPDDKKKKKKKNNKKRKLLPSQRYPNAPIEDHEVTMETPPSCKYCQDLMHDTGMVDVREKITVIPKKYVITRFNYHIYGCKCHGHLKTTPTIPQITPGSVYSDDMVLDIAISKYFDLIPIERYVSMAANQGFPGLPANSLIDQTHQLAFFLLGVYSMIKKEVLGESLIHADETPHKMLEGSEKKNWYLWEFSNMIACYFECHSTRSGDVASDFLLDSSIAYLMSDVYSGYKKAIKTCNKERAKKGLKELIAIFCNAHSRRKFCDALPSTPEAEYFILRYKQIYAIENELKLLSSGRRKKARRKIRTILKRMKKRAETFKKCFSSKSGMGKACSYFIKNFEGLSFFTFNISLPIDNNHAERLLRSPVVGRKTWLGTHSEQGAETAAILFSIMQSCRLNKVNPREYLKEVIKSLHESKIGFTPHQYAQNLKN